MKKFILLCSIALGAMACQKEDVAPAISHDIPQEESQGGREDYVVANGTTPENLKLKERFLAQKASKLRSIGRDEILMSEPNPWSFLMYDFTDYNLTKLQGVEYYIDAVDRNLSTTQRLHLADNDFLYFATPNPKGDVSRAKFTINSLASYMGIPYTITKKDRDGRFVGSGIWERVVSKFPFTRKEKVSDIAYLRRDKKDTFGAGWDLLPLKDGFVLQNDMLFEKEGAGGYGYNVEHKVLTRGDQSKEYKALLTPLSSDRANQLFRITPVDNFKLNGIYYFASEAKIREFLYANSIVRAKVDTVFKNYPSSLSQSLIDAPRLQVVKLNTITETRRYRNESYREQDYDMHFDIVRTSPSSFTEFTGLHIPILQGLKFPLPVLSEGSVLYAPTKKATVSAPYSNWERITRSLTGVLPLTVSPRTEVEATYTYTCYRLRVPYVIVLSSAINPNVLVRVLGVWEGEIYVEDDDSTHSFIGRGIDSDDGGEGDDEIIFFNMSHREVRELNPTLGNELRSSSFNGRAIKRIHI